MPIIRQTTLKIEVVDSEVEFVCNACGEDQKPGGNWHKLNFSGGYQHGGRASFVSDFETGEALVCSDCLRKWEESWSIKMDRGLWMGSRDKSVLVGTKKYLVRGGRLFESEDEADNYNWNEKHDEEHDEDPLWEIQGVFRHPHKGDYQVVDTAYLGEVGMILYRVVPGPTSLIFGCTLAQWSAEPFTKLG